MANSVATLKAFKFPRGGDNTQRNFILRGTISLSGGGGLIYPVGGYPISWTTVTNQSAGVSASGQGYIDIPSTYVGVNKDSVLGNVTLLPTEVDAWSSTNPPSGYTYVVDGTLGNLHIMVPSNGASGASGPMIEFGGTVVSSIQNDVIQFVAIFPRL